MAGLRTATGLAAVVLVAVATAVAQSFGRFTYGVLLPAIRDDLGISNTLAGSLATVNVGAYLVGTLAVAAATSVLRLLVVMRIGVALTTLGLLVAAVSPGPWVLGIALVMTGLGGAFAWIPAPVVAAAALAPERRSVAVGILGSGLGLGVVVSGQLSGFVRSSFGDAEWRTVFAIEGGIGVVVTIAALLFIRHEQDRLSAGAGLGGFAALRRMRGWAPYASVYTTFGLLYLLNLAFLTTRLEDDSGWSSTRASLAFTLLGVAMLAGGPFFLSLAARFGTRRALMTNFATWAGAALLVLPGWLVPTMGASITLGLLFGAMPPLMAYYALNHTAAEDYGPAFAAATLAFGLAQMVSPQLGGLIADAADSFAPVFVLSSILAVLALFFSWRLPRDRSHEPDEATSPT